MKCKEFNKLIYDFLDRELRGRLLEDFSSHLQSCTSCKRVLESTKELVIDPFNKVQKHKVPDEVWHNVEQGIKSKGNTKSLFSFIKFSRPLLYSATAISLLVVLTLVGLRYFRTEQISPEDYLLEEIEYIYETNAEVDFGTSIEEYFL